ncbi:uncharacterized protein LOC142330177 [Lycorma delicatula]|uniref:uncharacterized protein LOC142330177 n=1 Tax=Lycorma delicatula TaxID=130591 RepID=UPI003F5101E3
MNSAGSINKVFALKDVLVEKEKLLEKQKRLIVDRDSLKSLVDKVKPVNDPLLKKTIFTSNVSKKDDANARHSFPTSLNQKKPLPAVPQHNASTSSSRGSAVTKSPRTANNCPGKSSSSSKNQIKEMCKINTDDNVTGKQRSVQKLSSVSPRTSPSLLKYNILQNINPKTNKQKSKQSKSKKITNNEKDNEDGKNQFFAPSFIKDYCNAVGKTSFSLPKDEYKDIMDRKVKEENKISLLETNISKEKENGAVKFFVQMNQKLEIKEEFGPIINCCIDDKNFIIIQRDKISVYNKKSKNSKEWILKDKMSKLKYDNVIKNMIITCRVKKMLMPVYCEVYLSNDFPNNGTFMKMAQYRFLNEGGKIMKEFHFGTFDCDLENFQCCSLGRYQCTIAVSCWAVSESKTIAWVFVYNDESDSMICIPMIPLKHEVTSLHDISVTPKKLVLLAFGLKSFTIWNGKTGERFVHCNIAKVSPSRSIKCLYGIFGALQKGFLFIMACSKQKIHMIAVNLATGMYKSLRNFKLPKDQTCLGAAVKEDKLLAITDKAVLCWSLKTTSKLQQLKLKDGDKPYLIGNKVLIMSEYNFKKLVYIKSSTDKGKHTLKETKSDISNDSNSRCSLASTSS